MYIHICIYCNVYINEHVLKIIFKNHKNCIILDRLIYNINCPIEQNIIIVSE